MSVPTQNRDDGEPEHGFGRVPPQDPRAEQCVLGAMLLSKDAIGDATEAGLKGRDFYKPVHETIYGAILDLHAAGEPADPITVADELTKRGLLAKVGGAGYVHGLVQMVPTAASAPYYTEIVRDKAVLRRLVQAGTRIAEIGYTQGGDANELVDAAEKELFDVAGATANSDTLLPFSVGYDETLDEIQAAANRRDITGVPTGFADLDRLTNGFQPGQMIVVAGRPAMGKTSLALDFSRAAAMKHRKSVAFFSLEMGRKELHRKVIAAEASVALHHINSGRVDEAGWERMARHHERLTTSSLHIDDAPDLNMMNIRTKARRLAQRQGLDMIVVDYLQLLEHGGRRAESRQQEVSQISRSLKLLAKELQVPVIALSQLNRGPEQRVDKKPVVSDLRESGSIEQDSDIVMLLHREDAYEKASPRAGEADVNVAKHRGGPTANITLAFQGHYSRFTSMEGGY
ncbi:replicative DNA helicase [Streptomyces xiamenensis]|uniref:replicative DNA helicase n=1 Tax=Streptomyces xiamenensis TaxID=408015 RepID=UPI0035DBDFB5